MTGQRAGGSRLTTRVRTEHRTSVGHVARKACHNAATPFTSGGSGSPACTVDRLDEIPQDAFWVSPEPARQSEKKVWRTTREGRSR
jgi:hypothetical protein